MEQMKTRRSIRKFTDKPVEKEKLMNILESVRIAPSGHNTQPWTVIVVESEETRKELVAADHNQNWMLTAPLLLVVVGDVRCRIKDEPNLHVDENSPQEGVKQVIRDTAIAMDHMLLEIENQGLGACWTAYFHQDDVRPILGIPEDKYVVGIVALGYAAETPKARPRRKIEDIVMYEKWQ